MDKKTDSVKFNKKTTVIIAAAVLIIVAAVIITVKHGGSNSANVGDKNVSQESNESNASDSKETLEPQTDEYGGEVASGLTVPDATSLDVAEIAGYKPKTSDINISSSDIEVKSVGLYSGVFIEDGSDKSTGNVAALVVTNKSEQMLQIGVIEFQVNDTETAVFQITNLPAGASAMVMEQTCREYSDDDDYSFGAVSTAFTEQDIYEDMFAVSGEDGELSLTNNTETTYSKIYVYYKYIQAGGAYLGGITYRTPFENVAPGDTVSAKANHYLKNTSVITLVTYEE